MMTVQGRVRQSGRRGLHARRPGRHGEVASGRSLVVRPEDVEVVVAPEWLADLHDPTLVISPAYVGPDRRRVARSATPESSWGLRSVGRIVQVVCMTALVVVPLTMIVNRSVPPAATANPPPATREAATIMGMPGHRIPHVSTVSRRKAARSEVAYRRASARWQARQVAGGAGGRSAAGSGADPSARSAVRASAAQSRANERALTRAVAVQLRADQRADQRAARAGARAVRTAGGGHHPGAVAGT